MERGLIQRFYVIEVEFRPWDPDDPRSAPLVVPEAPGVPPAFQNEAGECFYRHNGFTRRATLERVAQTAKEVVKMCRAGLDKQQTGSPGTNQVWSLSRSALPEKIKYLSQDDSGLADGDDSDASFESFNSKDYEKDCHNGPVLGRSFIF